MNMRAKYLARVLLDRSQSLAGHLVEKFETGTPGAAQRDKMRELVAKVLVVEEGITEESKIRLVLDALPSPASRRRHSDRDLQELAECLEARLWK